jgi:16S rRNA (cytosine1402-N4)-methyltransferase
LDGTLGGGGHAEKLLINLTKKARYIGIDQDKEAIEFAKQRLNTYKNITYHQGNFVDLNLILNQLGIKLIDGVLLDLGVSSYQIDTENRGFSYMKSTDLDMRMNQDEPTTAGDLLNNLDEHELSTIFHTYGEERRAKQIAKEIVIYRKQQRIRRSDQLKTIIAGVVHPRYQIKSYARIFQALRIAVNHELDVLQEALEKTVPVLCAGGRCLVISYHSLEDRIVKNFFRKKANPCICPPEYPQCICGLKPELKILTKKPIKAGEQELKQNPRARSAVLRVGEKI